MSIVRENLMNELDYTPYCGNGNCVGRMPRTSFDGEQFKCHACGWRSAFEVEFIDAYKAKWAGKAKGVAS